VGLFLAVLELIRRFEAVLEQDGLFGEIYIGPAASE
jgi:chromatin segregation and condensation protein Rec8/ScpA/Scc1 (kleisin family)